MAQTVHGNITGLKANQRKQLERLHRRRLAPEALVTADFAYHLTYLAAELNRKVAVLVDRRGRVDSVVLGDAHRIYLPDVGRQRAGGGRLRGLRVIVATPTPSEDASLITRDELTDLAKLRLDAVVSVLPDAGGRPTTVEYATVVPGSSKPVRIERLDHISELNLDFGAFISELESELGRRVDQLKSTDSEPALLVHVDTGESDSEARKREMLELCRTAGIEILDVITQRRKKIDHRYAVGRGKLEEIELRALELGTEILVFGRDLSPAQAHSISGITELKVLDRTQVILDIFAQHAKSRDGKLQVELAQLKYTLPKLAHKNTALSRLMGGIGGRGPGETKLEVDRRRARDRINRLGKELKKRAKQRKVRRSRRLARNVPVISLVGYTNAGKSTLLNALTNADVDSEDKLFATLDPASRRLRFPEEREVVLTDTVGFIRDLPKDLVAAFKATLEEIADAHLLLHVVDASDRDHLLHIQAVEKILKDLDLNGIPRILVLNKCDLMEPEEARGLATQLRGIPVSALQPETTEELLEAIDRHLWKRGLSPDDEEGEDVVSRVIG